jgi:hypothetical protein
MPLKIGASEAFAHNSPRSRRRAPGRPGMHRSVQGPRTYPKLCQWPGPDQAIARLGSEPGTSRRRVPDNGVAVGRRGRQERPFVRPVIRLISRHAFTIGKPPVDFRMEVRERGTNIAVQLPDTWPSLPELGMFSATARNESGRGGTPRTMLSPMHT